MLLRMERRETEHIRCIECRTRIAAEQYSTGCAPHEQSDQRQGRRLRARTSEARLRTHSHLTLSKDSWTCRTIRTLANPLPTLSLHSTQTEIYTAIDTLACFTLQAFEVHRRRVLGRELRSDIDKDLLTTREAIVHEQQKQNKKQKLATTVNI